LAVRTLMMTVSSTASAKKKSTLHSALHNTPCVLI
jgi:hypothetical protein